MNNNKFFLSKIKKKERSSRNKEEVMCITSLTSAYKAARDIVTDVFMKGKQMEPTASR